MSPTATMATNAVPPMEGERKKRELLSLALQELGIAMETLPYLDRPLRNGMIGVFCKNLFLKDRKGQFYLVICPEDKDVNLKSLKVQLGAHRNFSFGSALDLMGKLGVGPGAVTPLGLIFDTGSSIKVVIDQSLAADPTLLMNFHPLTPDETTLLTFENLETFVKHTGHSLHVLDLESPGK